MIEGKGTFFKMSSFGLHHGLEMLHGRATRVTDLFLGVVSHTDDREAFRWSTLLNFLVRALFSRMD